MLEAQTESDPDDEEESKEKVAMKVPVAEVMEEEGEMVAEEMEQTALRMMQKYGYKVG
jgi:hypothetical protein